MKVIGFNFPKISAERFPNQVKNLVFNTDVEFTEVEKEKVDMIKDDESIRIGFTYAVNYQEKSDDNKDNKSKSPPLGNIILTGNILLTATKDELKEIFKYWKKKQLPPPVKVSLFNLILKKCSPKAVQLEDEINLPIHLPLPQIKQQTQEN